MAAAESIGSPTRIQDNVRHVIPNIVPPTIVIFTTTIGAVIWRRLAWLSFLGYGLPPDVAG